MFTYELSILELKKYLGSDIPYVAFDQYDTITRIIRDNNFAPERVERFHECFGKDFFMWTKELQNEYQGNNFYATMTHPWVVSIDIPFIDNMATFPLKITIQSGGKTIFKQRQKLAVQKIINGKAYTSGWSRVPQLRKAILKYAGDFKLSYRARKRLEEIKE